MLTFVTAVPSDPGNILLAENIRRNSKYLTQLLTCRVKSAPIGLLHPTMLVMCFTFTFTFCYYSSYWAHQSYHIRVSCVSFTFTFSYNTESSYHSCRCTFYIAYLRNSDRGLRTKAQATTGDTTRGAISAKPRTTAVTVSPATEPVTSNRTEERKTKKSAQNQRFMIIRTAPAKTNKGLPEECNRKTKRASSAKFQEPLRLRARSSVRRRSESFTARTRPTSEMDTNINNRSFSAEPRRNGVSLNSRREQNIVWSRTKGSQGLSLSNICRPLPISYNNFLVQTTSSTWLRDYGTFVDNNNFIICLHSPLK